MTSYLDLTEFDAWARDTISADAAVKTAAIETAESMLNTAAGRTLTIVTGSTTATDRRFRPAHCTYILPITDLATVVSVTENGTALVADTDYVLEPFDNIDPASSEWRPYTRIVRRNSYWYTDGAKATVTINGKWGWTTIPKPVKEATKVLAADWLSQREVRNGTIGATPDGIPVGMRDNVLVRKAINTIRGHYAVGIAG